MNLGQEGKPNRSNWEYARHCASQEDAQIENQIKR